MEGGKGRRTPTSWTYAQTKWNQFGEKSNCQLHCISIIPSIHMPLMPKFMSLAQTHVPNSRPVYSTLCSICPLGYLTKLSNSTCPKLNSWSFLPKLRLPAASPSQWLVISSFLRLKSRTRCHRCYLFFSPIPHSVCQEILLALSSENIRIQGLLTNAPTISLLQTISIFHPHSCNDPTFLLLPHPYCLL